MVKILLTSTSFQDTPGKHHDLLNSIGYSINFMRGPLKEEALLPIIAEYDGVICGDDAYTQKVLEEGKKGNLKVISKYGIGLDKINLEAAKRLEIKVFNCQGVNHTTVAEHVFALLLSYCKNIIEEVKFTRNGKWTRLTGTELIGKTLGIVGLGKIGKEVAKRANAFGMHVIAYDRYFDDSFANELNIGKCLTLDDLLQKADIVSLNMDLNAESKHIISANRIKSVIKKGCILINTARGELVDTPALIEGLQNGTIGAYLTDVLDEEPMPENYPLSLLPNVLITPHIGSRTFESVERQGIMAIENLLKGLS